MTRKRSRHSRRLADPIALAMGGAALLCDDERRAFLRPAREAIADMACGRGSVRAWQALADAFNLSEALAELRIAGNLAHQTAAAQAAMAALMQRVHAGRGWTLHGPELTALREGLWVYQVQLEHCSAREYRRALEIVTNRVRAALAGNASPRTTVHAPPANDHGGR